MEGMMGMVDAWQRLLDPMQTNARALLDLVYPRVCAGCGASTGDRKGHICWDCAACLQLIAPPFCQQCGDPVEGVVGHEYSCSLCQNKSPFFVLARSAARYRGVLQRILQAFKYEQFIGLGDDLVELLVACSRVHYGKIRFDEIVHVPLHPRKERVRTYNQAFLLARGLARRIDVPFAPRMLRRVKYTESQTGFNAWERRKNIRGAFVVEDPDWVRGRTILLIDDVMTTGATVNECSQMLKESGAAGVYVLTVARG